MTDTTKHAPHDASASNDRPGAEPPQPAVDAAPPPAASETAPAPEPAPTVEALAAMTKEAADLKERLLRTLAEMENLRRRTEREVADTRVYGIAGFARDVLGVADNMRRALDAIGAQARADADAASKSLIDGIELTERELLKAMEKHGVRRFDPAGEKFDPNRHQAMFEIPDAKTPAGHIVQVVQAGFMIAERVLRPALVGISKGAPKAPPAEATVPQPANDTGDADNGEP
ncbi:MAG: nucleotide exchange factor GrpE [Proteobacteria bacterium]|nr:nucleotide exchange factor GrpE [Pseudomonadota bacterium]